MPNRRGRASSKTCRPPSSVLLVLVLAVTGLLSHCGRPSGLSRRSGKSAPRERIAMTTYLVAGATGQLGRPTLEELLRRGLDVRGLSRRGGPHSVGADLLSGDALPQVLAGVDVVVHCATTGSRRDVAVARNLTDAARVAGVGHLVLISIVGIDRIPFAFYRVKLAVEEVVRESGVPFTIQRATQFHSFLDAIFSSQRRMPAVLAPAARFPPIPVEDMAGGPPRPGTGGAPGRGGGNGGPPGGGGPGG